MSMFQWVADRFPTERVERSFLLKAVWRTLFALLRPRAPLVIRTQDYRLHVDPRRKSIGRSILRRGGMSRLVTDHFRERVKPGMTVVDIGANLGHYTMVAARAGASVRAYEPDPGTFAELVANLQLNGFANVTPVQAAVSDRRGKASFFVDAANSGGHSLARENALSPGAAIEVPTVRLDDELAGGEIDILKIDAQGAEGQILEGARGTLERSDAKIYFEFWPLGLVRCGRDPDAVLATLAELGYRTRIVDVKRHAFREPRPGEIEEFARGRTYHHVLNFYLERG